MIKGTLMKKMQGRRAWISALTAVILTAMSFGGWSAMAQTTGPALTQDELRTCLCEEQAIATLRQETQQRWAAYNNATAQEKKLNQQINEMRAKLYPYDPSVRDQLDELIALRDRVHLQVRAQLLPTLQQSTRALNDRVANYNARCVGRIIYNSDEIAARQNLVCPKP
jgi:DNA anti-recombination protein RmuC